MEEMGEILSSVVIHQIEGFKPTPGPPVVIRYVTVQVGNVEEIGLRRDKEEGRREADPNVVRELLVEDAESVNRRSHRVQQPLGVTLVPGINEEDVLEIEGRIVSRLFAKRGSEGVSLLWPPLEAIRVGPH